MGSAFHAHRRRRERDNLLQHFRELGMSRQDAAAAVAEQLKKRKKYKTASRDGKYQEFLAWREAELVAAGLEPVAARRDVEQELERRLLHVPVVGLECALAAEVTVHARSDPPGAWAIREFRFESELIPTARREAVRKLISEMVGTKH